MHFRHCQTLVALQEPQALAYAFHAAWPISLASTLTISNPL